MDFSELHLWCCYLIFRGHQFRKFIKKVLPSYFDDIQRTPNVESKIVIENTGNFLWCIRNACMIFTLFKLNIALILIENFYRGSKNSCRGVISFNHDYQSYWHNGCSLSELSTKRFDTTKSIFTGWYLGQGINGYSVGLRISTKQISISIHP